jgi:hypothetical protein
MEDKPPPPFESRRRPRFLVQQHVPARFAGFEVVLHDISEAGCQIHHAGSLKMGATGTLQFEDPTTHQTLQFRGRVVWSRLARDVEQTEETMYHSALRFSEVDAEMHTALARFVSVAAQYDRESLDKKRQALARKTEDRRNSVVIYKSRSEIPFEVLRTLREAREQLLTDPTASIRWYQRARYSRQRFKFGEGSLPYQDEVIAVWEMVGRKYPLTVVAMALSAEE